MKKVFVLVCAMAALTFTSCNSGSTSNDVECDSVSVEAEVDSIGAEADEQIESLSALVDIEDADGLKTKIEEIKGNIQKLIDEGKVEEAQKYSAAFKQFVDANKEKINSVSPTLGEIATNAANHADEISNAAVAAVGAAVDGAKETAVNTKDEVVAAGKAKVQETRDAANAKIQEAQDKAVEKVQDAQNKAAEKVQNAQDNAKNKANQAIDKAAGDLKNKLGLQ